MAAAETGPAELVTLARWGFTGRGTPPGEVAWKYHVRGEGEVLPLTWPVYTYMPFLVTSASCFI